MNAERCNVATCLSGGGKILVTHYRTVAHMACSYTRPTVRKIILPIGNDAVNFLSILTKKLIT